MNKKNIIIIILIIIIIVLAYMLFISFPDKAEAECKAQITSVVEEQVMSAVQECQQGIQQCQAILQQLQQVPECAVLMAQ